MKKLLMAFLATTFMVHAAAQTPSDVLATLVNRYSEWMNAYYRGDGAAMDAVETRDLMLIQPDGELWSKEKPRIEMIKPRQPLRTLIKVSDAKVRVMGDAAILTGTDVSERPNGSRLTVRFTTVWHRENAVWKVWSAHWTSVDQ